MHTQRVKIIFTLTLTQRKKIAAPKSDSTFILSNAPVSDSVCWYRVRTAMANSAAADAQRIALPPPLLWRLGGGGVHLVHVHRPLFIAYKTAFDGISRQKLSLRREGGTMSVTGIWEHSFTFSLATPHPPPPPYFSCCRGESTVPTLLPSFNQVFRPNTEKNSAKFEQNQHFRKICFHSLFLCQISMQGQKCQFWKLFFFYQNALIFTKFCRKNL